MSLLPGNAKILEYKIIDHLGSGGFANTYSALDTNLDKKVAIKEFFPLRLCHRGAEFRVDRKGESQGGKRGEDGGPRSSAHARSFVAATIARAS